MQQLVTHDAGHEISVSAEEMILVLNGFWNLSELTYDKETHETKVLLTH